MNDRRIDEMSASEKRELLSQLLLENATARTSPLSYAQQRLWFLDQLAPGSAFYNVPIALRLRLPVDIAVLRTTLNEIVRRHEVLRTTFVIRNGEPVQLIAAALTLDIVETDLRHLPEGERESEAQRLATTESRRPFDLSHGPLIRAGLLRLGEHDYMLLLTLHHIVSDGWSLGILFGEISALYASYADGRNSGLPELPIQYADYARWQRGWLEGAVLEQQLAYWKGQLDGLPQLVLPTDRPRPAIATFRGARKFFSIDSDIVRAVEELARRTETTLFMVLHAAFQVLMGRYSGQTDFPVGAPIANRTRKETEGLIGFFVNTLVLRADLSGDPTFRQLLARVRESSLTAYEHQDLPFERLVEELHPRRDAGRTPLIQVMFALQNAVGGTNSSTGSPLEVVEVERGTANFDLVLDLWQRGAEFGGRLEYSTDLFDAPSMDRLLGHYRQLLAAATARPDEPISALTIMTESELYQLVVEWNATESDYPDDALLSELFESQAAMTPDAPALWYEGESLSYAEVNSRANRLAHYLRSDVVRSADLVAIYLERSAEHVIAMLGVLKAGAVYVPLDPSYPKARLRSMMIDARPRAVITSAALIGSLPVVDATVIALEAIETVVRRGNPEDLPTTGTAADPAYVMYTSGSTGAPKGIVIPQRAISRLVRNTNYIQIGPEDRIAQASNLSFDASTFEVWGALLNGAQLVEMPKDVLLSAEACESFLLGHRITTMFLTTAVFNQIAREHPAAFRGLRTLLVGGEAVDPGWMREVLEHDPPGRLLNAYGPTECTTFATWHRVDGSELGSTGVPIGRPVGNTRAYVLDAHRRPVPIGVLGELYLGGPGLALGYLGQPELTAEAFVDSPFGRLYRTGDLVRLRSDLALTFHGRRDTQIKLRGHRIELEEIEATLLQEAAVREAKVVLRATDPDDQRLAAYVVLDAGAAAHREPPPNEDRVREWKQIYDDVIYDGLEDEPIGRQQPHFNIAGWKSSYTGQPISPAEMREQVDQTVERILAAAPAEVLEIGCGTGLLLFRLAASTRRYLATDFSRSALDYVQRHLDADHARRVTLVERTADDFGDLLDQRFDMVILNSVIQYFPSADYLHDVLHQAASVLKPGGSIFVGDVRNLELLGAFHAAVELHQASSTTSTTELRSRVRDHVATERELLVSPQFFQVVAAQLPSIIDVTVRPKRGRSHNELTRFRYDVLLCTEPSAFPSFPPRGLDWTRHQFTLQRVRQHLIETAPELLRLEQVPNARSERDVEALRRLDEEGPATVGELRRALNQAPAVGIDPEDLWELSDDVPYAVDISWAGGSADGSFDVMFRRLGASGRAEAPRIDRLWQRHTNHPERAGRGRELIPQIRDSLQQLVPEYMIPSAFVVLDHMPLTPNGKVDVDALPPPDTERPALSGGYLAPRSALERVLAGHWASVLGLDRVGVTDDFFELGGHSLLATQLVARLTATLEFTVSLRTLFAHPTVLDLAAALLAEAEPAYPLERVAALVLAVSEMPEDEAATMLAARSGPMSESSG